MMVAADTTCGGGFGDVSSSSSWQRIRRSSSSRGAGGGVVDMLLVLMMSGIFIIITTTHDDHDNDSSILGFQKVMSLLLSSSSSSSSSWRNHHHHARHDRRRRCSSTTTTGRTTITMTTTTTARFGGGAPASFLTPRHERRWNKQERSSLSSQRRSESVYNYSAAAASYSYSYSSRLYMATWSDSRAVRDYQDFLSSGKQEIELSSDRPSVIIRPPPPTTTGHYGNDADQNLLANALYSMGNGNDVVITPYQDLPETLGGSTEYPIYITLPPYQIESFLVNLPDSYRGDRSDDFVFFSGGLQYGNIEDALKNRGYCRDSMTQVLISGMKIIPVVGSPNNNECRVEDISTNIGSDEMGVDKIAGECTACGKWSGSIAGRLHQHSIRCKTDFYREWRRQMWERNVMDAVFHIVGSVRDISTTSVADVANYYSDEVSDIIWDMSQLLRGWRAITLLYGFEERIFGVAECNTNKEQLCTLPTDMYPYIWGNQVFLQSKMFVDYLHYAQSEKKLLQGIELPIRRGDDDFTSKMRQGNLRADGVI